MLLAVVQIFDTDLCLNPGYNAVFGTLNGENRSNYILLCFATLCVSGSDLPISLDIDVAFGFQAINSCYFLCNVSQYLSHCF